MPAAVRVSWLTCVLAAAGASALRAPVQPRSRTVAMAWPGVGLSREAAPEVVEAESRKIADEKGLWMDRALTVFTFVVPVAVGDAFGVILKPVAGGDAGVLGSFMLIIAALLYINADDAAWSDLFDNRPMVDDDVLLAFQAFDSNRSGKMGASAPALLLLPLPRCLALPLFILAAAIGHGATAALPLPLHRLVATTTLPASRWQTTRS